MDTNQITTENHRDTTISLRLKERWQQYQQEHPHQRMRDAANDLGVSEAELLAVNCDDHVTRLSGDWGKMLQEFPSLGEVMSLTRNEYVVHEKTGKFDHISVHGKMGLVLNEEIDLRIFLNHWHSGFAVSQNKGGKTLKSFQFFAQDGVAVYKVYLTDESNQEAYHQLLEKYRSDDQSILQSVSPTSPAVTELADEQIDVSGFQQSWDALQDTHEFFGMLKKFNVTRIQGLRLAGKERAYRVATDALQHSFALARDTATPIMVFVGNPGIIQIHTGTIHRLKGIRSWFNVLDPSFNLHLREDGIGQIWVVKKPTVDGMVHSLEIYTEEGDTMVMIFGKRKPGQTELPQWVEIIEQLKLDEGGNAMD